MKKIAVVTGAAGGMGRAIVDRLRADNFHVIGLDIDAIGLADMLSDGFEGISIDLTDP